MLSKVRSVRIGVTPWQRYQELLELVKTSRDVDITKAMRETIADYSNFIHSTCQCLGDMATCPFAKIKTDIQIES